MLNCQLLPDHKDSSSVENLHYHLAHAVVDNIANKDLLDFLESFIKSLLSVNYIDSIEIYIRQGSGRVMVALGQQGDLDTYKIELENLKNILRNNYTITHTKRKTQSIRIFPSLEIPVSVYGEHFGDIRINLNIFPRHNSIINYSLQTGSELLDLKLESLLDKMKYDEEKEENLYLKESSQHLKEQISSLSKELYAITAISTNLHPKIEVKNFINKSLKKTNEIFKSSIIALFIHNEEYDCCNFSEFLPELGKEVEDKLYKTFHNKFFFDAHRFIKPTMIKKGSPFWNKYYKIPETESYELIVCSPLQAQKISTGLIFLLYENDTHFDHEDIRLLAGISNIIGTAIENKILYIKSQHKLSEEEFLYQCINQFHKQINLEKALKSICKKSIEYFDQYTSAYLLTNSDTPLVFANYNLDVNGLSVKAHAYQEITPSNLQSFHRSLHDCQEAFIVSDIEKSIQSMQGLEYFQKIGSNSLMIVPLQIKTGLLAWLIVANCRKDYSFSSSDLELLVAMVNGASIAVENIKTLHESQQCTYELQEKLDKKNQYIDKLYASHHYRIEHRKDIVFWVNKDYILVFANKAMEDITGYSKIELYNMSKTALDFIAPRNHEYLISTFSQVFERKKQIITDVQCVIIDCQNEERFFSFMLLPLRDEEDNIIGLEVVGRDLTEEKRLELELKKNKELALLGEFSSAMAHQLRNPLGNILMGTKRLQQTLDSSPESSIQKDISTTISSPISDIINEIYNMNQIITELTEYTKSLNLRKTEQDIQQVLEEALSALREIIDQHHIQIFKHFPYYQISISADAILLTQAIQNIIHNALQVMTSGGELHVTVQPSSLKAEYVHIAIQDTGPGLDTGKLEKIFRPFYTTKDKGTGLGLSLCHRIIEAHQGFIWAAQNKSRGLTFNILLPR